MSYYIHQTPGRLRIRTPVVKNNEAMAIAARSLFHGTLGVKSVLSNVRTGSITVIYDPYCISSATLINELAACGYLSGIIGFPCPLPALVPVPLVAVAIDEPFLSPQARKWLGVAAKMLLPVLAERILGRPGKILVSSLL